jgi:predicted ATPase/class 3 adenylate cyclase
VRIGDVPLWDSAWVSANRAAAPSGVVTFLFTDVEGSTRRWEADADVMRNALAAHDDALRTAIEAHGGFLFKHTGDGVCAAFASPRSAVDAAVAAQRGLELPVRMGLATGEAELRDGDYFGAVLNRAARVMAAGHGGQILLAHSTTGLLSGVDLVDLGPRRLRDLPTPVGLFQVRASGLREDFPPLRTLDTSPGNLRRASSSLIGRESEVDEIEAAVRNHRVVTLTGVGGVGKTRLALEVAARLADEFPDGVWVFELAAVNNPAAVPEATAEVMGIAQLPGKTVAESVAAALEGRVRLMVIDNCEHVLDAAANLIEAILTQSATVRVLATSREALRVTDEHLWPVPSLEVGAGTDSPAASLFVERARAVSPRFSLSDADKTAAVVDICSQLDGIPLAIELAASRMASMTPTEMRDRLDQRFRLLVGSGRGLARHQTLRQAVAWSYELLDDAEKSLLERCSVFAGGFEFQSACALMGSDDDIAVLDLLDALVRKSLLVADRSSVVTRFSMLETIREFAEEQLIAREEAADVRSAHARYFAQREPDILALWDSPRQREAYAWFSTEFANLRTAFRWAADHGDLDVAAPIATYAALFGVMVENYEPLAWAEELIKPAAAVDHRRLASLYAMATQCWMVGRIDQAVRYSEASQPIFPQRRDGIPSGFEVWFCAIFTNIGQPDRSIEWCRTELASNPDAHVLTKAGMVLAMIVKGSHEEAIANAEGLTEDAEATRNPHVIAFALYTYGLAHADADPVRAREVLRRGLVTAQDSGNRYDGSNLANVLGRLEALYGDPVAALDYLTSAIGNYRDSGNATVIRLPLGVLAALLVRLGFTEPASIIAGFAFGALTKGWIPELGKAVKHLRAVLGGQTYESLARKGESMTTAAMAAYAFDEIDQARTKLKAVPK